MEVKCMVKQANETVLNATLTVSVIGIFVIIGLMLIYPRQPDDFTALYFVNGSQYTKVPVGDEVYFNFTIENHDVKDSGYLVDYLIDGVTVNYEVINVERNSNVTLNRNLNLSGTAVHKVGIILNRNPNYEIHFWTVA
jgi:hypothetical protein